MGQRSPKPRAMMPRSTSVVPPWMVSLGAMTVAKASCSSKLARLASSSVSAKAASSRTRAGQLLLPDGAEVLDDGAFHHRLLAGLQHAVHRDGHAPQRVQLRDEAAQTFGRAQVGIGAEDAHETDQRVEGFEEALGPAALVGQFAGGLLPGAVDLAQHMIVGNEGIGEDDLVEVVLAADLVDRVDGDAGRLHVDEELREAVAAVLLRRRRGAEQADHVVGLVRVAGPDLGAVDEKAAVGLGRLGLGREQVGAGARLAHADGEAHLAAADARQDVGLDALGCELERIGPLWRSATKCRRTGALATRNSSVTT